MNRSLLAETTTAQLPDEPGRREIKPGVGPTAPTPSQVAESGLMPPHPEVAPIVPEAALHSDDGEQFAVGWSVKLAGIALAALAVLVLYIGLA